MKTTRLEKFFEIAVFSFMPFCFLPLGVLAIGWGINTMLALALIGVTVLTFFSALGIIVGVELVFIILAISHTLNSRT